MKKKTYLLMALAMVSMGMNAQNSEKSSLGNDAPEFVKTMKIGGTIRSKYEYQTEEGEGRFEVRTARINVAGNVTKEVSYKAEIDLCDEGKIKMLDAYTRIKPWKTLQFTIGQERVPFTIDAHRSPHQQYFANRSFIAKQVGNVRDVGAEIGYTWNVGFPNRGECRYLQWFGLDQPEGLLDQGCQLFSQGSVPLSECQPGVEYPEDQAI